MNTKGIWLNVLILFLIFICFFLNPHASWSEDKKQSKECITRAIAKINNIRSFPDKKYLHTLDGQYVLLNEFYAKCDFLFPKCCLFKKFYYWQSETREVVSNSEAGMIKHKVRCYNNCLSDVCPERQDLKKTHGDVAEFYDRKGTFMGLSVYMGDGKYCALPYHGYRK